MKPDQFTDRVAKIRERFAGSLGAKIDATYAALPQLSGAGMRLDTLDETYRRIHTISGIGPTVGFAATGRSAAALEATILAPYRARRGLTDDEFALFRQALDRLREAAAIELQSTEKDQH